MNSIFQKQAQLIKKELAVRKILTVRFANVKPARFKRFQDTVCTALARVLLKKVSTFIDREQGQLCSGGDYFLKISNPSLKEVCKVYVKDEKVFKNEAICKSFLKKNPKYPNRAKKRYILLSPLDKETQAPAVVILLVNPAQAGRILGLSVRQKMKSPLVVPALSTCASIYAPLEAKQIHLNFIDYYDRYHQGKQKGRLFWLDEELLISMPYATFKEILKAIPISAHGSYQPGIRPKEVEKM